MVEVRVDFAAPDSAASGDPMAVALQIERISTVLGKVAAELGSVTDRLADAEILYEDAFEAELEVVREEYEADEKRLPGEDVRRALIHKRIDRELYRDVKRLTGRQQALEKFGRLKSNELNGLQSELSMLRAEDRGPTARANGHVHGRRAA
jgi:hypothetical protein